MTQTTTRGVVDGWECVSSREESGRIQLIPELHARHVYVACEYSAISSGAEVPGGNNCVIEQIASRLPNRPSADINLLFAHVLSYQLAMPRQLHNVAPCAHVASEAQHRFGNNSTAWQVNTVSACCFQPSFMRHLSYRRELQHHDQ